MFLCAKNEARGMKNKKLISVTVGLVLAMVASTGLAGALTRAADDLVADQLAGGNWPDSASLVGESTIGLVHAYELTGNTAYRTAAENAGRYSLNDAGYDLVNHTYDPNLGLYPAEAYAMARLSVIQGPGDNIWRTALVAQLDSMNAQGIVDGYLASTDDPSPLVYNLARIAVAADYVNDGDKEIYRDGVKSLLATVNDTTSYTPVMALGAAVWALASTGDISTDSVLLDGVSVTDLPQELADLQAGDGSFFALFDGTIPGETETTVMGTLGLMTADATFYAAEIADAVGVLESGVGDDGEVYSVIGYIDPAYGPYYELAGETLEVIPEPATMTMLLIGAVSVIRRRRSK